MSKGSLLALSDIEVNYSQSILAIHNETLEIKQGSIVSLFGANGAGKTTILRAISKLLGQVRGEVTRGTITYNGDSIGHLSASDLVTKGIVQVLEGRHVFPQLTIEENLMAGAFLRKPNRKQLTAKLEQTYEWFPRLKTKRKTRAGFTSGGEQQMLVIGRALMTDPVLVLLDEPSMGLAPIIVQEIFGIIKSMNSENGVSFLIAEQNANLAMKYADYCYILENGVVVIGDEAVNLSARDDIKEYYLGSH
jgi:branched-chain amino acid transport system ATP-binding protein